MSERSRSSVNLDVDLGTQPSPGVPESDTPFRILVLGDFSGGGLRGERAPLAGRRPKAVDCDNLDAVIASLAPSVQLAQTTLRFRSLDDFHPDAIYKHADLFHKLADMRNQPAPAPPPVAAPAAPPPPPPANMPSGRSLLDSMVERSENEPTAVVRERDALAELIQKAVKPHLVAREDPHQKEWVARVDAAAGHQMRMILHDPLFQSLEAAWRGVDMLVNRLQPDADLKLYVFDATVEELMANPNALDGYFGSSRDPWALIVGNFVFEQTTADAARLRWLGRLAARLGAPFLAETLPPSDATPNQPWHELAHSPEARWIGLALPRFLLRLPYGKDTSPAEQLAFEEMPESVHAHYLWGNPAFFCACAIGLAFRSDGWQLNPSSHRQLEGLPQHIYRQDGESVAKPCAELLLTENDADFILNSGFMPLASMKDQDSALLVRVQSIADPLAPLSGRWATSG